MIEQVVPESPLTLPTDERLDVDKDIVDRQAERQGRILVGVERHVAEKLRKPVSINVQEFYKSTASLAFAKDVYKDRHIRQAVMFVLLETLRTEASY